MGNLISEVEKLRQRRDDLLKAQRREQTDTERLLSAGHAEGRADKVEEEESGIRTDKIEEVCKVWII
jgi:hypothetical protein